MGFLTSFFLFLLGLAVGSFINVVVYRLNHNLSPFKGRSFCPKCKKKIVWHDNFPLLSFAFLKGRCRSCHSPISFQYPLVELGTGLAFLAVFWGGLGGFYSPVEIITLAYYLFLISCLVVVFVSDLLYLTVPDLAVWPALLASGGWRIWASGSVFERSTDCLGTIFLPGLAAAAFFLLIILATRGKGMGVGDVKLAFLIGVILGWSQTLVALSLAFLTGALVGVILILVGKKRFGEHVPFGPFLVAGVLIALFWGEELWRIASSALLW